MKELSEEELKKITSKSSEVISEISKSVKTDLLESPEITEEIRKLSELVNLSEKK